MSKSQVGGLARHEDDEGGLMQQPGEHAGQALAVVGQPAASGHPGKAPFPHPAPLRTTLPPPHRQAQHGAQIVRQQLEAARACSQRWACW